MVIAMGSTPDTNLFRPPQGPVERVAVTEAHRRRPGDPFAHDRFLLRQKHLALNEKYDVCDAEGKPLLSIERPTHLAATMLVALASGLAFLVVGAGFVAIGLSVGEDYAVAIIMVGLMAATAVSILIARLLATRRDVTVRNADGSRVLVSVRQDRRFQPIIATFTVCDGDGQPLARLRKNYLANILRRRWRCTDPEGEPLCQVVEDHAVLALARRLLGPLLGLLRTNYVFLDEAGRTLGRFNRRFTLLERYVLDLTPDLDATLDRRIAVCLGIMLDTGERR